MLAYLLLTAASEQTFGSSLNRTDLRTVPLDRETSTRIPRKGAFLFFNSPTENVEEREALSSSGVCLSLDCMLFNLKIKDGIVCFAEEIFEEASMSMQQRIVRGKRMQQSTSEFTLQVIPPDLGFRRWHRNMTGTIHWLLGQSRQNHHQNRLNRTGVVLSAQEFSPPFIWRYVLYFTVSVNT